MNQQKLFESLEEKQLDTLLLLKDVNIFYMSGFMPSSPAMIIVKDEPILYTSKMELNDAENISKIPVKEFKSFDDIKEKLKGKIGIERSTPFSIYEKFADDRNIHSTDIIETLRLIKSSNEIKNIKKSIKIAERAMQETDETGTEFQIAAQLEYRMKYQGSLKPAFNTIVASGSRSSIPHATISKNNVEFPLVIDWGAVYNNYCSDITRTYAQSEYELDIYSIVLEAQQKAIKAIKPGVKASYIDKVARRVIEEYGYGENFTHSTGHGLGLEIHENPTLSMRSDLKLEKGMVVTVEPGIYIPDQFGVRIEDDVLIKNRAEILTSLKS